MESYLASVRDGLLACLRAALQGYGAAGRLVSWRPW
jgi:hypothetical protein